MDEAKDCKNVIFFGLMLGTLVAAASQTIISPAMPVIVADLGGIDHYSWVATSTLLVSAVTIPIVGKLADVYGRRAFFVGFGVPDETWGERAPAAVALRPDRTAAEEELIKHCRQQIARYKAPRGIDFHDELPKSGAGKILKRDLRGPYWEGIELQVH